LPISLNSPFRAVSKQHSNIGCVALDVTTLDTILIFSTNKFLSQVILTIYLHACSYILYIFIVAVVVGAVNLWKKGKEARVIRVV